MFELRPVGDLGQFALVAHAGESHVVIGEPMFGGVSGAGTDNPYAHGIAVAVFGVPTDALGVWIRQTFSSVYSSSAEAVWETRYVSDDGGRTWRPLPDAETWPFTGEPVTHLHVS